MIGGAQGLRAAAGGDVGGELQPEVFQGIRSGMLSWLQDNGELNVLGVSREDVEGLVLRSLVALRKQAEAMQAGRL